ncbi:unnamed protein product, partial [Prorocentrum cordatum]
GVGMGSNPLEPRPHSRAVVAWVGGCVAGGFHAASVYLPSGDGVGAEGRRILFQVGEFLFSMGKPFVIGGDFNALESEVRGTGLLEKIDGVIILTGKPTCRVGKDWRDIDFFIVSASLVPCVWRCDRLEGSELSTHYPIRMSIRTSTHLGQIRYLWTPKRFPDLPIGPAPAPPGWWEGIQIQVEQLVREPAVTQAQVSQAYASFCQAAELELADMYQLELSGSKGNFFGRGDKFNYVYKPAIVKVGGPHPLGSPVSRAMRKFHARLEELGHLKRKGYVDDDMQVCEINRKLQKAPEVLWHSSGWREWRACHFSFRGYEADSIRDALFDLSKLIQSEEASWVRQRQKKWRSWASEAVSNGGSMVHRWVKVPNEWIPDEPGPDGTPGGAMDQIEALESEWKGIWRYGDLKEPEVGEALSLPFTVNSSIVAGCSFATTLLKIVLKDVCDEFMARWPRLGLALMVDDSTIQALGSEHFVKKALVSGTLQFCRGLEALEMKVSRKKCILVASDIKVGRSLQHSLREFSFKYVPAAKNLGVDFKLAFNKGRQ